MWLSTRNQRSGTIIEVNLANVVATAKVRLDGADWVDTSPIVRGSARSAIGSRTGRDGVRNVDRRLDRNFGLTAEPAFEPPPHGASSEAGG